MQVGVSFYWFLLALLCAMLGFSLFMFGRVSAQRPECVAGASSVAYNRSPVATYLPKGCVIHPR